MSQSCCKENSGTALSLWSFLPLPLGEGLSQKIFEMGLSWPKTTVLERLLRVKLRTLP